MEPTLVNQEQGIGSGTFPVEIRSSHRAFLVAGRCDFDGVAFPMSTKDDNRLWFLWRQKQAS